MKIFAVSDLHLSFTAPFDPDLPQKGAKPMDIFGAQWGDHPLSLARNWRETIGEEDTVLIPGDISWAMNLQEARYDLDFIGTLPGRKLICRGNHDYWWDAIGKVRSALPAGMEALQHDATEAGGHAICATRGWLLPGHCDFKESSDRKIFDRELLRLGFALKAAAELDKPIIVMLHYPPVGETGKPTEFTELMGKYPVCQCVYGHIHGDQADVFEGELNGIVYTNVSVDRLGFRPFLLCENQ
ncbi:MAG: metallophosphoesterase [Firmicutes bacterium]|nr:metallophosphoesterase [Bacillota bacterium]